MHLPMFEPKETVGIGGSVVARVVAVISMALFIVIVVASGVGSINRKKKCDYLLRARESPRVHPF